MRPINLSKTRLKQDGLSLQHFLIRTEMIKAYRTAVRSTRPLPDSMTRRETLDWLRADLDRLRGVTDLAKLKESLSAFSRNHKQFVPSLGLSTAGVDGGPTAKLIGRKGPDRHEVLPRRFFA